MNRPTLGLFLGAAPASLWGCDGPVEASQVQLPTFVDRSGIETVTTDLGYVIEMTEGRAIIEDVTFASWGDEIHMASVWRRGFDWKVPDANAHPGHPQGGEITGELPGRFILDWMSGAAELGPATLLAGLYDSANFTFTRAGKSDGVAQDDPLYGHTAFLRGRAYRGADGVEFLVTIDSPEGRELNGAPFEFEFEADSTENLGIPWRGTRSSMERIFWRSMGTATGWSGSRVGDETTAWPRPTNACAGRFRPMITSTFGPWTGPEYTIRMNHEHCTIVRSCRFLSAARLRSRR